MENKISTSEIKNEDKEVRIIHHWLGILALKLKPGEVYSTSDLREIKNLSLNIYMDADKYLFEHREKVLSREVVPAH